MIEISNYVIDGVLKLNKRDRVHSSTYSKGNQIKWRIQDRDGNGIWVKADSMGYEGLAESAATYILSKSNIRDYVRYYMTSIDEGGKIYEGCVSRDFMNTGEVFITIWDLFKTNSINKEYNDISTREFLKRVIRDAINITRIKHFDKWIGQILEFDTLILNDDRHFNNLGVIYNEDKDIFRTMPIFDNGKI